MAADPEQLAAWPAVRAIVIAAFVGSPEYVERLTKGGARIDGFAGAALGDRKLVEKTLRARPELARERDGGLLTVLQCAAGSRIAGKAGVEIAALLLRLHRAMVESALAEAGLPGDELPEPESGPGPLAERATAVQDHGLARRGVRGASA